VTITLISSLSSNSVLLPKCSVSFLSLLVVVYSKPELVALLLSTSSNSSKKDIYVGILSVSTSQLLLPSSILELKETQDLPYLDLLLTRELLDGLMKTKLPVAKSRSLITEHLTTTLLSSGLRLLQKKIKNLLVLPRLYVKTSPRLSESSMDVRAALWTSVATST
jgi:hypothetical protein